MPQGFYASSVDQNRDQYWIEQERLARMRADEAAKRAILKNAMVNKLNEAGAVATVGRFGDVEFENRQPDTGKKYKVEKPSSVKTEYSSPLDAESDILANYTLGQNEQYDPLAEIFKEKIASALSRQMDTDLGDQRKEAKDYVTKKTLPLSQPPAVSPVVPNLQKTLPQNMPANAATKPAIPATVTKESSGETKSRSERKSERINVNYEPGVGAGLDTYKQNMVTTNEGPRFYKGEIKNDLETLKRKSIIYDALNTMPTGGMTQQAVNPYAVHYQARKEERDKYNEVMGKDLTSVTAFQGEIKLSKPTPPKFGYETGASESFNITNKYSNSLSTGTDLKNQTEDKVIESAGGQALPVKVNGLGEVVYDSQLARVLFNPEYGEMVRKDGAIGIRHLAAQAKRLHYKLSDKAEEFTDDSSGTKITYRMRELKDSKGKTVARVYFDNKTGDFMYKILAGAKHNDVNDIFFQFSRGEGHVKASDNPNQGNAPGKNEDRQGVMGD